MITLPRIAGRIFGEPLAIEPRKLDVIVTAIGPRLRGAPMDDLDTDEADEIYQAADGIATIHICGTLVATTSGMQAMSGMTSYADICAAYTRAMTDPSIKGIAMVYDSPGGEVNGMLDCADMMFQSRGSKPVCAIVDCAASAAYLLASTADQIVVSRTSLTGSIGIIAIHEDQSGADAKDGLKYTAVYAGARKNDGNPHVPLTPEAQDSMQSRVDQVYGMFVASVARNRGMKEATVTATEAAIYMGADGISAGLADEVATADQAMAALRSAATNGQKSLHAGSVASATNSTKEKNKMLEQNAADAAKAAEAEKQLQAAMEAAKTEGYADAGLIVDLCSLSGNLNLAAGFLAAKKPVADVRKDLIARRAKSEEVSKELNPGMLPGIDAGASQSQGKAKPWGEVLSALGFKKK